MNEQRRCERCGGVIPSDAPEGECPACLLEAGLHPPDEGTVSGAGLPDREELAKSFPQLEILERIGQGGMGVVYKARQRSLDRLVALKVLSPAVAADPSFAERFNREARAMARLAHPNIIAVYESGKAKDLYFLIMEYVDGVNLFQAQRTSRLVPKEALAIVPQICDALQYAHAQGVVHRDIKPANILITNEGQVKIADFGLAKLVRGSPGELSLTREDQVMGTLHYMAPEQIQTPKDVDHRADLYSLGVVFYEMLTGELPLGRFLPPSEKVEVDVRLDRVVLRSLESARERRYQHAEEIKTDVSSIEADPRKIRRKARNGGNNHGKELSKLAVMGLLGIPLAALVGLVVYTMGERDETAMLIGCAVALIGTILSVVAWYAIRADPKRLSGRGLAKAGVLIPLCLLLVALVALPTVYFIRKAQQERAHAWAMALEDDAKRRKNIQEILMGLEMIKEEDLDSPKAYSPFIDPSRRAWFQSLSKEEFARLREEGKLGLLSIDTSKLPEKLSYFEFERYYESDFDIEMTLSFGNILVTFPLVKFGQYYYLGLGETEMKEELKVEGL